MRKTFSNTSRVSWSGVIISRRLSRRIWSGPDSMGGRGLGLGTGTGRLGAGFFGSCFMCYLRRLLLLMSFLIAAPANPPAVAPYIPANPACAADEVLPLPSLLPILYILRPASEPPSTAPINGALSNAFSKMSRLSSLRFFSAITFTFQSRESRQPPASQVHAAPTLRTTRPLLSKAMNPPRYPAWNLCSGKTFPAFQPGTAPT
jgi:hypothetical protein